MVFLDATWSFGKSKKQIIVAKWSIECKSYASSYLRVYLDKFSNAPSELKKLYCDKQVVMPFDRE